MESVAKTGHRVFEGVIGKRLREVWIVCTNPDVFEPADPKLPVVVVLQLDDDYYALTASLSKSKWTRIEFRAEGFDGGSSIMKAYDWSNDKSKGDFYKAEAYINLEGFGMDLYLSAYAATPITGSDEWGNSIHDPVHACTDLWSITAEEFAELRKRLYLTNLRDVREHLGEYGQLRLM